MGEFDYANARIRAMKSRILTMHDFSILAESPTIDEFILNLSRTAFQKAVEHALTLSKGMASIPSILRFDMKENFRKIQTFFSGKNLKLFDIIMLRYDVANIKSVLRSVSQPGTPDHSINPILPAGKIPVELLERIAATGSLREAVDMMATLGLSIAHPLITLPLDGPHRMQEVEMTLEHWFADQIQNFINYQRVPKVMIQSLKVQADIQNLVTLLRFALRPDDRLHMDYELENILVHPGFLSSTDLSRAYQQENLEAFINSLKESIYAPALSDGFAAYQANQPFSEIEKALQRFKRQYHARLIVQDPLGIGVTLGYLTLKDVEIQNIRHCALQIHLGFPPATIIAGLEGAS